MHEGKAGYQLATVLFPTTGELKNHHSPLPLSSPLRCKRLTGPLGSFLGVVAVGRCCQRGRSALPAQIQPKPSSLFDQAAGAGLWLAYEGDFSYGKHGIQGINLTSRKVKQLPIVDDDDTQLSSPPTSFVQWCSGYLRLPFEFFFFRIAGFFFFFLQCFMRFPVFLHFSY